MSDLRARAAAGVITAGNAPDVPNGAAPAAEELPHIEYTDPIADIDAVPVHVAWIRVMRDVKSIDKRSEAKITTTRQDGTKSSYTFNYRGIDKVLNAVGPALRRHGVVVVPARVETTYGNAGRMRECLVTVTYRVIGPDGSHFEMVGVGEGLDAGERATPKALTTAYRNMLITALTIPTEDPKMDPDVADIQREAPRPPTAEEYYAEITSPRVSLGRLRTIHNELKAHPDIASMRVDEPDGVNRSLSEILSREGSKRMAEGGAS